MSDVVPCEVEGNACEIGHLYVSNVCNVQAVLPRQSRLDYLCTVAIGADELRSSIWLGFFGSRIVEVEKLS